MSASGSTEGRRAEPAEKQRMSPRTSRAGLALVTLALVASCACGYRLTTKGNNLPDHVKIIAVPELSNNTNRPELGQRLTENLVRELVSRGRYSVVSERRGADAVLSGTVLSWDTRPLQLSEEDSDAERVTVTLTASITFDDRVQRRVTWQQDGYKYTGEYDVIGDADDYFDTDLDAVEEVAADFARALVSSILQGF